MRYKNGTTKPTIRAATKGFLPDKARNNFYKHGWNAPTDKWLRREMKAMVEEILADRKVQQRGIYNISAMRQRLTEHVNGQKSHAQLFWQLINYEHWYQNAGT